MLLCKCMQPTQTPSYTPAQFQVPQGSKLAEDLAVKNANTLNDIAKALADGFNDLLEKQTGKIEVTNQRDSVKTPDVANVVSAIAKLDKNLGGKIDTKALETALKAVLAELKKPKQSDTKTLEAKFDGLEKAIRGLTVNVEAPMVNVPATDLKPVQTALLSVTEAIKAQPLDTENLEGKLDSTNEKLDQANKHLDQIAKKKFGGGGGITTWMDVYVDQNDGRAAPRLVYEAVQTVPVALDTLVEDTGTYIYVGKALPGVASSAAEWRIKRVVKATNSSTHADGTGDFTKVWDDRAGYSY